MIHQDYIARIRYSNTLPPPPHPPKLLDIPNTGLASGQYTSPSFASRLAREQPLNIEADAELGMPLDLVGMPGVFDGDESCTYLHIFPTATFLTGRLTDPHPAIQALAQTPLVHAHDRPLLRPLSTLGKPKTADAAVSFLRRTEYISSVQTRPKENIFLKPTTGIAKRPEKRKVSPEPDKGTPAWIKRRIEKSFEIAAAHLADVSRVRHPSKRNVKLLDSFPVLPDLDAFPDSGAYVTVKFQTNPVNTSDSYDTRLLSGIFKPIERSAAEDKAFEAAFAAFERDPANNAKPSNMMNYDFFLPADKDTGERFRQRFDVNDPRRHSPSLYTLASEGSFRFPRVRAYETAQEKEMDHDNKYDEEVILAYHRDETDQRPTDDGALKAVYYYPVMQRSTIRSQRTKNIARTIGIATDEEETHLDELHVQVDEPSEELRAELLRYKHMPVGFVPDYDDEDDADDEDRAPSRSASPARNGKDVVSDQDQDAEGEEED